MIPDFVQILQLSLLVKLFVVVLTIFYLIFCLVIYRQIVLMTKVLQSNLSSLLKTLALVQIAIVGVIFLLALFLS